MKKIALLMLVCCFSYVRSNDDEPSLPLPDLKKPVTRQLLTAVAGYFASGLAKAIMPNDTIRLIAGVTLVGLTEYLRFKNDSSFQKPGTNVIPDKSNLLTELLENKTIYTALLYCSNFFGYAFAFSHPSVAMHLEKTNKYLGSSRFGSTFLKDNHVYSAAEAGAAGLVVGVLANKVLPSPQSKI